jgi:hypothetical protein
MQKAALAASVRRFGAAKFRKTSEYVFRFLRLALFDCALE